MANVTIQPNPMKNASRSREMTQAIAYGGMAIALSTVLSLISVWPMPQGGGVTPASMFPLILVALIFGPRWGFITGATYGMVQLLINPFAVHPIQVLLDYPVAFAMVGLAGLFTIGYRRKLTGTEFLQRIPAIPLFAPICGTLVVMVARFAAHYVSGAVFFGSYAQAGQSVWIYSLIYNASYMVPEAIVHTFAAILLTLLIGALRLAGRPARPS